MALSPTYLLIRDNQILNNVRTTWSGRKLQLFVGCLFGMYNSRTKAPELLFLQYQPGDYEKAANEAERLSNEFQESA